MSDVVTRLGASLSDRYRLERELGVGGMATVEGRRTTLPFMSPYRQWDLTPDDAKFIVIRRVGTADGPDQLVVVENLFADLLERKVP